MTGSDPIFTFSVTGLMTRDLCYGKRKNRV
jgi:hypothetical protein